MLTLKQIRTTHKNYPFVEELLNLSFPEEERRDNHRQRCCTDNNPRFACYLISKKTKDETPIGVVTVWNLDGFRYIEHLATAPSTRNKGYGKQIMQQLQELFPGTIVLEVERPENEMSKRRIGFYQRCGFSLCTQDYMQPAYRAGGAGIPLYLMYAGTDNIDRNYTKIRDEIYREVYGVTL